MKYETRVLSMIVVPAGEAIFHEAATVIKINDDAAGEFVVVSQDGNSDAKQGEVCIEPEAWPQIRDAIDKMVSECRK